MIDWPRWQLRSAGAGRAGREPDLLRARPGQALVIAAPLIATMLVIVAMVVDLGIAFATQHRLQQAVDGAAVAGAMWIDETALRADPTCIRLAPGLAAAAAAAFFAGEQLPATLTVDASPSAIRVTASQTLNLTLLGAFQNLPNTPLPREIRATARGRPEYTNRAVTCPDG